MYAADTPFNRFQVRFLDSFWKEDPGAAIGAGYGKYYERLWIPETRAFEERVSFCRRWLDSLFAFDYSNLSNDDQINFRLIQNELQKTIWYIDTFRIQQWDPSRYNIGDECYGILTQPFKPLTERLRILSAHLQDADHFYQAAVTILHHPTREHTQLAIQQNEGSMDIFGSALDDSMRNSSLSQEEKDTLGARAARALHSIRIYVSYLRSIDADPNYPFRDCRIGRELYYPKFRYDLVTDLTPEEMFQTALAAKVFFQRKMFRIADGLWRKYNPDKERPSDSLALIKSVLDRIADDHAAPDQVVPEATGLVHQLESFVLQKDLFNYDTSYPLVVRIMPAFMAGISLANAEFTPPYLRNGVTYYNVSDLSRLPVAAAESELREYNRYSLQLLTIHEAIPGHCFQGVYNQRKSESITRSVFQNGAMTEGWAVYCEQMMVENGWGNHSAEIMLTLYKWRLRELSNVLVDYGLHCLHWSREDITKMLKNETFQEDAQVQEKYHRATLSQVQLCSYYTGLTEILSLRDAYKDRKGKDFQLKDFHEKFLSYGSSPVRYIREMMLR